MMDIQFKLGIWRLVTLKMSPLYSAVTIIMLAKLIHANETTSWSFLAHFLSMLTFGLLVVIATRVLKPLKKRPEAACLNNWSKE
jgi:hypothetical protein